MKLRNKKTGDIWDFSSGFTFEASYETAKREGSKIGIYTCYAASLAELNEDWEDYKPAEPLIKDEKIRKAVRAWAEACSFTRLYFDEYHNAFRNINDVAFTTISFLRNVDEDILPLEDGKTYTIAELCGEEE